MVTMVETRVGKVAYSDVGEGPAVVLLHATLHDRHDFDPIVERLQRDYRVIALDWPGHGESPAPSQPPTAALYADVLADVVAALDLPPAAFVGNSVGVLLRHGWRSLTHNGFRGWCWSIRAVSSPARLPTSTAGYSARPP